MALHFILIEFTHSQRTPCQL